MGNIIPATTQFKLNIIFDKREAISILNSAEYQDYYLESCHSNKLNSLSRKDLNYSPNTVSTKELLNAITFINGVTAHLPRRLLQDLSEIQIIQLMPTADGGMPHTRPSNIICYPDIAQLFSKTTLIHELWHIHQRNYKDIWTKIFEEMGWREWSGQIPNNLDSARRFNPDTIDCPYWIYRGEWIPIPIFVNITHPKVADVEIWFYNPEKKYHIKTVPSVLTNQLPGLPPNAYEHPREIAAYILSEPDKYAELPGFKLLVELIGVTAVHGTF